MGLPDFREEQVENLGLKEEISHFSGFRREYSQIVSKWLGDPSLHIFGPKISLSYKNFGEIRK